MSLTEPGSDRQNFEMTQSSGALRTRRAPGVVLAAFGLVATMAAVFLHHQSRVESIVNQRKSLTKASLAEMLRDSAAFFQFPAEVEIPAELVRNTFGKDDKLKIKMHYAFDAHLQEAMQTLFKQYHPDYGAFVAMDAQTGQVLSMVSYSQKPNQPNLTLRATFPSASVFKVVTAAAAIETQRYSADTVIPFNGRSHTLYRNQIFGAGNRQNRWTRYISLKEAFAKSINTVFGRIGAFAVGPTEMREYADRFGFNRPVLADFPVQEGKAAITDDPWGLAEASSGFTTGNTMSPMQGAMIAASVANGGVMMEPYIVSDVTGVDGADIYKAEPKISSLAMDSATSLEVRKLMNETVRRGTSSHSFRGFFKREFAGLDVGGKTGSLTGFDPPGKYDWFVGFADSGTDGHKIAVAALTVHEKVWRVKSSYLARRAFESYFAKVGSPLPAEPRRHRRHRHHLVRNSHREVALVKTGTSTEP